MVLHLLTLNCIWLMQFNVNKCRIMSVGKGNRPVDYTLNDITLGGSYSVRDLKVQVNSDLSPREQCIVARNRANKMFLLPSFFSFFSKSVLVVEAFL